MFQAALISGRKTKLEQDPIFQKLETQHTVTVIWMCDSVSDNRWPPAFSSFNRAVR